VVQTTRRQFVGIVLSSAVLQTANRLAGAEKPSLYVRAKDQKAIDKIRAAKCDVVVLQEQSLYPIIDRQSMAPR
jgi:hypothetical protein